MAILSTLPGLKVTIVVNHNALQEYEDADFDERNEAPREVSKYVASCPGAPFSVRLECTDEIFSHIHSSFSVWLLLDGDRVCKTFWNRSKFLGGLTLSDTITKENGQWYRSKFKFCDLQISEEGPGISTENDIAALQHLGSIVVQIYRANYKEPSKTPYSAPAKQQRVVSEKQLKGQAKSHQSSFGEREKTKPSKAVVTQYIDPEDQPFARYNFLHRSLNDLKLMRIISPTPSPVPGNDNEFEELSLQDIDQLSKEQLQALLRGRINSEATTKRERPSSTIPTRFQIEDGELEITKERSCKRQRFSDSDITGDAIVL